MQPFLLVYCLLLNQVRRRRKKGKNINTNLENCISYFLFIFRKLSKNNACFDIHFFLKERYFFLVEQ